MKREVLDCLTRPRRVAVSDLQLLDFATRIGAKYESQYESEAMRICNRRWRIRRRLEDHSGILWPLGLDEGFPPKPPRMHWRTYRRLQALAAQWGIGIRPSWIVQIFATSSPVLPSAS